MRSTAIHQNDDWFLVNLPEMGALAKEKIEVEIEMFDKNMLSANYKALRSAMILERNQQKKARSIAEEPSRNLQSAFDEKFRTSQIESFGDVLTGLEV